MLRFDYTFQDEVMVVAGEGGNVFMYSTADYQELYKFPTDTIR